MLGVAVTAFLVYKYFALNKKATKPSHIDNSWYQKPGVSPSGTRKAGGGFASNHTTGLESERLREEIDRLTAR